MSDPLARLLRWIPPGTRGKGRLARLLLRHRLRQSPARVSDRYGNCFEVPDLHEPIAFHLLIDGVYEPELIRLLFGHLKRGDVFVDIGANVGVFTMPAARHVGESGRVLAVEASPAICSYLNRNAQDAGLHNVTCRCAAVCEQDGEVEFYDAPARKFGMGSLTNRFEGSPVKVQGRTLDRVLFEEGFSRVNIIKVDVEGFELKVFEGATGLLSGKQPPLVVFEFCDWAEASVKGKRAGDAQRFLMESGYRLWLLEDYVAQRKPLREPLTQGFAMLVATR